MRHGLWVALVGIIVIQFCLFPVGIYAHGILDQISDTDLIVPTLLNDPAVFRFGSAICCWSPSWPQPCLPSIACCWSRRRPCSRICWRLCGPVGAGPRIRATRVCVVGFALLAALLALRPPSGIVEITTFSGSLYAVCFLPAVLFGLYWRRGDAFSVVCAMAAGVGVLLLWLALGWHRWLHEVFPALATSTQHLSLLFLGGATASRRRRLPCLIQYRRGKQCRPQARARRSCEIQSPREPSCARSCRTTHQF